MRLGYVILYVPDVPAAVAFYEKAFRLKARFVHESGYAEMETGATALGFASEELLVSNGVGARPNRSADQPAGIEIALVTDTVNEDYRRAVAAGAVSVKGPARKPWGQTVAYVRDLNGCLVEICSPVAPA